MNDAGLTRADVNTWWDYSDLYDWLGLNDAEIINKETKWWRGVIDVPRIASNC